jgi:hypothetical protein
MIDTAKADNSVLDGSQVVRISRDLKSVVVERQNGTLAVLTASSGEVISEGLGGYYELPKDTQWRRLSAAEVTSITASLGTPPEIEVLETSSKTFRVPPAIKEEIQAALAASADIPEDDLRYARALAFDDTVGMPEVSWMHDFFDNYDTPQRLRGGFKGQKWASKILDPDDSDDPCTDDTPAPSVFDGDQYSFYGIGADPDSTEMHTLIAVDFDNLDVLIWNGSTFEPTDAQVDDIDEPQVLPLDNDTASYLAGCISDDSSEGPYDVLDSDPLERNLFALADAELDYEDLDRQGSIIADATGYSPAERSHNAKRQMRSSGGTFGGRQVEQGTELQGFKKAKLSDSPALVPDVAGRIQQFLSDAPETDAGADTDTDTDPVTAAAPNPPAPAQIDSISAPVSTNPTSDNSSDGPSGSAVYFAIVDPTDTTAVLNVVAIAKDSAGTPQAWVRTDGAWKNDPATLASLTGATPPPVIELTEPDPAKSVIAQVDASDGSAGKFPTDPVPTKAPVTASGFVVPGTDLSIYGVDDIIDAVSTFDTLSPDVQPEAKRIIRTRATALNRKDLLPVDWRTISHIEMGEAFAAESPLYSEFGEVLVAAGHPFKGAKGAERLKEYWIHGEGAAKIRWGTKGDLTRCHNHLVKYVGPMMAWGLAQNYHKALFHMSNAKHDKLTGQTSHHGG